MAKAHTNGVKHHGGFRVPPKSIARLKFADGDYEGAEVECALDVPSGFLVEFGAFAGKTLTNREWDGLFRRFGKLVLLNWNIEDDEGQPIPSSAEGMSLIPQVFAQTIISEWTQAVIGVPVPLETASNSGGTSLEASMPMETSSESRPN